MSDDRLKNIIDDSVNKALAPTNIIIIKMLKNLKDSQTNLLNELNSASETLMKYEELTEDTVDYSEFHSKLLLAKNRFILLFGRVSKLQASINSINDKVSYHQDFYR